MPAAPSEEGEAAPARGGGNGPLDLQFLTGLEGMGVDAFVDWTPYTHPTLGEVEIGGFRPYVTTNPPVEALAELGRAARTTAEQYTWARHTDAVLGLYARVAA